MEHAAHRQKALLLSLLAIAALALILVGTSDSDGVTIDDLKSGVSYEITSESPYEVMVTAVGSSWDGTIPDTFISEGISYSVTGIGEQAFRESGKDTVTLPASITTIHQIAFLNSKFTSISVDENNLNYKSVNGAVYSNDCSRLVCCPDGSSGSFTVAEDTLTIANSAFRGCYGVTEVILPTSLTSIGAFALAYSGITTIDIPANVQTIASDAFYYCSSLTAINVDEENATFASHDGQLYNKELTRLILHPTGKSDCNIPSTVVSIDRGAFDSSAVRSVTIPTGVTEIKSRTFYSCTTLESITIPDTVTTIGSNAFHSCNSLVTVDLGNVQTIENEAFSACRGLTSVTLSDSIQSIGRNAFATCTDLSTIVLESVPESIWLQVQSLDGPSNLSFVDTDGDPIAAYSDSSRTTVIDDLPTYSGYVYFDVPETPTSPDTGGSGEDTGSTEPGTDSGDTGGSGGETGTTDPGSGGSDAGGSEGASDQGSESDGNDSGGSPSGGGIPIVAIVGGAAIVVVLIGAVLFLRMRS